MRNVARAANRSSLAEAPAYPAKPAWAAPCNGCGLCCVAEPCPVALQLGAPLHKPCPYLEWHAVQFRCGLMLLPLVGPIVRDALGAGLGCDARGNEGQTVPSWLATGDIG